MANIWGDLTVTIIEGMDLQNMTMFGACNPYILAKLKSSTDIMETTVKDGETDPAWQESFTFRNASASDALQIFLMEKMPTSEGVVSSSRLIYVDSWGFPGVDSGCKVIDVPLPPSPPTGVPDDWDRSGVEQRGGSMGTVRISLRYRADLPYRRFLPLDLLRMAAAKTGMATKKAKIDAAIAKLVDVISTPVTMVGGLSKKHKLAAGGTAVVAGGGFAVGAMVLSVPVLLTCLLFLPLTLLGGAFAVMVAFAIMPFLLALAWVVLCSEPVQGRLWQPLLLRAVAEIRLINVALLRPAAIDGKEQ